MRANGHRDVAERIEFSSSGKMAFSGDGTLPLVGELVQVGRDGIRVPDGPLGVVRYRLRGWLNRKSRPSSRMRPLVLDEGRED